MNKWTHILAVSAVFVVGLSPMVWSVENPGIRNPGIRNPAGISSVPPSSLRSGQVTAPNPLDRSGNLGVTGQVRRGRHFRGSVPYGSRTDFGSGLGTTVLDSFMRDSAGYEDFGSYRGKYGSQPYYSRLKTVPTTTPGRPGVFAPVDTRVAGRAPDVYGTESLLKRQGTAEADSLSMPLGPRSRPLTADEIKRLASGQTRVESPSAEMYRMQLEQIRLDLLRMRDQKPELKTDDKDKQDLLGLLPQPGGKQAI